MLGAVVRLTGMLDRAVPPRHLSEKIAGVSLVPGKRGSRIQICMCTAARSPSSLGYTQQSMIMLSIT
jgi:hypothetical protein